MKFKQYFENFNNEVTIGDIIKVSNSPERNGVYIILSNEVDPTICRSACSLKKIEDSEDYQGCAGANLYYQEADENADVEILGNIFKILNIKNLSIKEKHMSITTTLKKITRKEPQKTFVKANFIDDETEQITENGLEALHYILWKEKKNELKELADKILKEEKN